MALLVTLRVGLDIGGVRLSHLLYKTAMLKLGIVRLAIQAMELGVGVAIRFLDFPFVVSVILSDFTFTKTLGSV